MRSQNIKLSARLIAFWSLCLMLCLMLSACERGRIINEKVRGAEIEADKAIGTISPDANNKKSLKIDQRPWYGSEAVSIQNQRSLPSELTQEDAVVMTFAGPTALYDTLRLIESVTGIRVILSNNVYAETLGNLASRLFVPTDGEEVSGGRVVWSGRLQDILDQIANTYGAEWSYDGSAITFSTEVTRTFMLHALSSDITVTGETTTDGGANAPNLSVDGTTTLEIWREITEVVQSMIGDQGQTAFSPSTGAITITARPEIAKRVERYLEQQNKVRLRRVAVTVKVLDVETSDDVSVGADVAGIIKGALGDSLSLSLSTAADGDGNRGLDVSVLKSPVENTGDLTVNLEASELIERASVVHSGSLVTLSDQPAPLQVARQIAFLERVTSSGDTGGVSLEPGTVDVGLFMTVLPRIVQDDRILMRLSIAITDATTPFRQFGNTEVQIELPEIDTTGFLQNAVVSNGETLVLAGFERSSDSLDDDGSPGFFLGGVRTTSQSRNLTVLMINARILPEEPITIIGQ